MGLKIDLELDYGFSDRIVAESLKETLGTLQDDLARRKAGEGCGIFDTDPEADVKELKKQIKATKRVLSWYAGGEFE